MNETTRRFSPEALCGLAEVSRRTLRYYVQQGLVEPPEGIGRGAFYTQRHLEQLLEIRKWQEAGLSLERIRELLYPVDGAEGPLPPPRPRRPGSVEVWSHVMIDDGIELTIEPGRAGLSPEALKSFVQSLMSLYRKTADRKE